MSYEHRQEYGRFLQENLSSHAAGLAPRGIHRWDLLPSFTAPAGVEFMLALSEWESGPSDATESKLQDAYKNVLQSWRRAAAEFCAERSEA